GLTLLVKLGRRVYTPREGSHLVTGASISLNQPSLRLTFRKTKCARLRQTEGVCENMITTGEKNSTCFRRVRCYNLRSRNADGRKPTSTHMLYSVNWFMISMNGTQK